MISRPWTLAAAFAVAMSFASAPVVEAQTTPPIPEQLDAGHKGLVGLGLVGAEIGFIVPALARLDDWYWYLIFPVVGATGGALAGHFAIDQNNQVEASVAMVTLGVALVIPTIVLTVRAFRYDPDLDEDAAPAEPASAPSPSAARARRLARAGSGFLRYAEGELVLAPPGIQWSFGGASLDPLAYGVANREVRVSLFSGSF